MMRPCNSFGRAGVKFCTLGKELVAPFTPIYVQKYKIMTILARILRKIFAGSIIFRLHRPYRQKFGEVGVLDYHRTHGPHHHGKALSGESGGQELLYTLLCA